MSTPIWIDIALQGAIVLGVVVLVEVLRDTLSRRVKVRHLKRREIELGLAPPELLALREDKSQYAIEQVDVVQLIATREILTTWKEQSPIELRCGESGIGGSGSVFWNSSDVLVSVLLESAEAIGELARYDLMEQPFRAGDGSATGKVPSWQVELAWITSIRHIDDRVELELVAPRVRRLLSVGPEAFHRMLFRGARLPRYDEDVRRLTDTSLQFDRAKIATAFFGREVYLYRTQATGEDGEHVIAMVHTSPNFADAEKRATWNALTLLSGTRSQILAQETYDDRAHLLSQQLNANSRPSDGGASPITNYDGAIGRLFAEVATGFKRAEDQGVHLARALHFVIESNTTFPESALQQLLIAVDLLATYVPFAADELQLSPAEYHARIERVLASARAAFPDKPDIVGTIEQRLALDGIRSFPSKVRAVLAATGATISSEDVDALDMARRRFAERPGAPSEILALAAIVKRFRQFTNDALISLARRYSTLRPSDHIQN